MLIDVTISGDRNMIKKAVEKILNIKILQENERRCGM